MASMSRARRVRATAMISHLDAGSLEHGGDLAAARRLFPHAPQPFIDLSTGINPHPYPLPSLAANVFAQLPDSAGQFRLCEMAARTYGTPTAAPVAGHAVMDVGDINELRRVDLAVIVNPNNPDGRIITKERLLALSDDLSGRGGLLAVDEAFMDVGPLEASLAGEIHRGNIIVLRSFGKFFGLAGLRLGFALAAPDLAAKLNAALGPWAVSGPAIAIAERALADDAWIDATRTRLASAAEKLDQLLTEAGIKVVGGTSLFRLVRTRRAHEIFRHLGTSGIIVRAFREQPTWLRFGIPSGSSWDRVRSRLATCGKLAGKAMTS